MTLAGEPRRDHLDRGDLARGVLVPGRVHDPRRLQDQQARLLDLDAGLGDPLADHALLGERAAEADAARDTIDHQLERALGRPDHPHAVVDAPRAEPGLGDREAGALLAEQVRRRHAHAS